MFKTPFAIAFALSTAITTSACVDAETDEADFTEEGRLVGNGLTPIQLWGASLNSAVLNATNLQTMASTADGRAALTYVVGCALNLNHNVSTTYDPGDGSSVPITFYGFLGLADGWTSTALTQTQQRWISGCTLGRVNKTGANITISMRGTLTNFALAFGESTNYPVQEGAFFGNVFQGTDFYVAACKGTGNPTATGRDCAKSDPLNPTQTQCQYTYAGTCATACSFTSGVISSCSIGGTTYLTPVTAYTAN
jgi:hypothetical protein